MQEITALRRAEQRISFSYGLTYAVPWVSTFSMLAHSLHRAVTVRSSIVQGPDMVLWVLTLYLVPVPRVLIWGPSGCTLRSNCIWIAGRRGNWGGRTNDGGGEGSGRKEEGKTELFSFHPLSPLPPVSPPTHDLPPSPPSPKTCKMR